MAQIKKLQLGGTTLHFGYDRVVDANTFNEKAAAEVEDYIASLNWSKKELERFRTAYLDLMSRGITGMLVINGVRNTTYEGEQIDNHALAKKLREAYGDAAYYINRKLEENSYSEEEKRKKEEKEEKKRLEGLPKYTPSDFDKFFIKKVFGGQENPNISDWDDMDKVDPNTHYRGIENRKQALGKLIEEYIRELPELNYEGSAFKDADEHKEKLENALHALQLGNLDEIKQALNAAGINWKHFLETDTLTAEGRLNYEQQLSQAQQLAGLPAQQQAGQQNPEQQTEQQTEQPVSGLEVLLPVAEDQPEKNIDEYSLSEVIKKNPEYFWGMVGSLAADVVSIIDPEPFSAAALGLGAAGARHYANAHTKEGAGFWSTLGDYTLGAIGAIPIIGDFALGARAVKTLTNLIKWGGKTLAGVLIGMGGANLVSKINSGEDFTFGDWKQLGLILVGIQAMKGVKSAKAVGAINAARGLKQLGRVKFKVKVGNEIKELNVELKDAPDAPIWKNLRIKSIKEQRRILSENEQVKAALHKAGAEPDDIILGEPHWYNARRNLGSPKIDVERTGSIYTNAPLTEAQVNEIADANRGFLSPKNHNRRVYQRVNSLIENSENVPRAFRGAIQRGRLFGRETPAGLRAYKKPYMTPKGLRAYKKPYMTPKGRKPYVTPVGRMASPKLILQHDGIMSFPAAGKDWTEGQILLMKNSNSDWVLSNTIPSLNGRSGEVIISNPVEKDYINRIYFNKNRDELMKRLMESHGIFKYGGKIYRNLDNYLTDFLINNK